MKKMKIIITAIFATVLSNFVYSQTAPAEEDRIIGVWLTEEGKGKVQITRYGDKYGGKIIWLKTPNDENGNPKVDKNNPDVSKRKNPTLGLNNLLGFSYEGDGKYENGTIYDPANGKTYKCVITYENDNTLKVRGYIGISMVGRTATWTRVK